MNIRKNIKFSIKLIIVIQAVLCLLMAIFFLSENFQTNVENYGLSDESSFTINLDNRKKSNTEEIAQLLLSQPATVIKENMEISQNSSPTIQISVGGDLQKAPSLITNNVTFFQKENLIKLSKSSDPKAIIGENLGSVHSIMKLPHILFGINIYADKLDTNINDNISGNYKIVGLNFDQQNKFLKDLSKLSGESVSDLQQQKMGFSIDNGNTGIILLSAIVIIAIILLILLVIYVLSSIKEIGNLSLLGWSKRDLINGEMGTYFTFSLYTVILNLILGTIISGIGLKGINVYVISGLINVLIVISMIAIASLIIVGSNILNAIRGKLPKKILYFFAGFLYIILSVGLVVTSSGLDKPVDEVRQNEVMLSNWSKVSNYETLKSVSPGNNQGTISGSDNKLDNEMWNWYKSIEKKDGVYLASGQYYSQSTLDNLQLTREKVPENPFTLLSFSPNYLKDHNIIISKKIENIAYSGTRVYLIPNQWSKNKKDLYKDWIKENDLSSADVNTIFGKKKKIQFIDYQSKQSIFTWLTESNEPNVDKEPVILVTTANNMGTVEYGSLRANVLTGPLKFNNAKTLNKYTSHSIMKKYQLDDNRIEFVPVKEYVSGLQRDLKQIIALFIGLIAFIIFTIALILITIAIIFSLSNAEFLFIKKILGFSDYQLYKPLIISVLTLGIIKLITVLILKSKLGLVLIPAELILEFIVIAIFIRLHRIKK
ncbi:hypothetical protein [Companilactobacillus metriopterae]|uniref:hypothetical protein n=1 Tax=Companilactobacillus metriopterae TaxID=1909267 RepID=UPI00100B1DD9|nr:hypothetical protein [Companilactobacillus metriopterae]